MSQLQLVGTVLLPYKEILQIYVDTVVRNPLINPSAELKSQLFDDYITDLIQKHHSFWPTRKIPLNY